MHKKKYIYIKYWKKNPIENRRKTKRTKQGVVPTPGALLLTTHMAHTSIYSLVFVAGKLRSWKENLLGLLNARGVVDNQLRKCRKEVVVN